MEKKGSVDFYIKLLILVLAIPFTVTVPVLVIILSSAGAPNTAENGFTKIMLSLVLLLWLLPSATLVPYCLRKLYNKAAAEKQGKQALIEEHEKAMEKQNKMVHNLTRLYNDLVEYDRQKTEFFSNVTHELKTPLTIILGVMQLIDQASQSGAGDAQLKYERHFPAIRQNCYRLLRLVNNILDISRLDSGYIKVSMSNCNLVYLIEEITQSVVPYAEQKNLLVEFDTDVEEITTAVDVDKMERIFLNLLSNAIKFTPSGGKISVTVQSRKDRAIVSVKDTGPGIPASMRTAVFERFRQLENSLSKRNEGSGIGLSIVKSFVDLHEGSIRIESEEGKGSEFIVELPIRVSRTAANGTTKKNTCQERIIESLNIEFSDIYSSAS